MFECPKTYGCLHLSRKLMGFVKDQFPRMISDFNTNENEIKGMKDTYQIPESINFPPNKNAKGFCISAFISFIARRFYQAVNFVPVSCITIARATPIPR